MKTSLEGNEISITVSIGISVIDNNSTISWTMDDLNPKADQALYQAKAAERNCIRIF